MRYKPYDQSILTMLTLCNLQMGREEMAKAYISRIKQISDREASQIQLAESLKSQKNYDELMLLLASTSK